MAEKIIAPDVSLVNGNPATTSLAIAECFGKHHKNVLRDIDQLLTDCPKEFGRLNFELSSYTNSQGKGQPMYTIFFDGFILLVMGYTGKKALQMKLAYIAAFNAMREKLEAKKLVACKQAALPTKDKYEEYMEDVENLRSRTASEIDTLLHKGLGMIDVKKLGTGAIIGFTPILLDWLQRVVSQHTPLISSREPMSRAIDYSPIYLIRHMEKAPNYK